jgi:sec-independent protein translocase protein TatC
MTTSETSSRRARGSGDDGRMPLSEHLRELRSRLVKSLLAVSVFTVLAWVYYDQIFAIIQRPLDPVIAEAKDQGRIIALNFADITSPFMTRLKISLFAGAIAASPIWIYQLWAFVTPGLHKHEKRWTIVFLAATIPLFFLGVSLGYYVLPKGLQLLLLQFAPPGSENILTVDRYLSFFIRTIIVFGVSFLAPVFIVALNFAGILTARTLQRVWRWIVMAVFVFAAVATPSQDPASMLALATPMLVLIFAALGICWLNDRRRYRSRTDLDSFDDDEASPIDAPEPIEQPEHVVDDNRPNVNDDDWT